MDIDEQLRDAGRRLETINLPPPEMMPLRERAIRSSRRRASAALVSLALVVGAGLVFAGSALVADGGRDTEVVAARNDPDDPARAVGVDEPVPTQAPGIILEPNTIPPDGGEVAVTVIGHEDERRDFNRIVYVYRVHEGARDRLGRLYLDVITGGGSTPVFDPSMGDLAAPPEIRMLPGETSEHLLTFPSLDPGDYEIEILIVGYDADDDYFPVSEWVTATLTVEASESVSDQE